jgi:hypothetical protein
MPIKGNDGSPFILHLSLRLNLFCRYAPFSSISERKSIFDDLVSYNPGPAEYDPNLCIRLIKSQINTRTPAVFGKSRVSRFLKNEHLTPGPAFYNVTSVKGETIASTYPGVRGYNDPDGQKDLDDELRDLRRSDWCKEKEMDAFVVANPVIGTTREHRKGRKEKLAAVVPALPGTKEQAETQPQPLPQPHQVEAKEAPATKPRPEDAKIIWKRKFIPPSIPAGRWTFGYDEGHGN